MGTTRMQWGQGVTREAISFPLWGRDGDMKSPPHVINSHHVWWHFWFPSDKQRALHRAPIAVPHAGCHLSSPQGAPIMWPCTLSPLYARHSMHGSNGLSHMACHVPSPAHPACCHHALWVTHSFPTALSSAIPTGDSSTDLWGHSDTHIDMGHPLRAHTYSEYALVVSVFG